MPETIDRLWVRECLESGKATAYLGVVGASRLRIHMRKHEGENPDGEVKGLYRRCDDCTLNCV